MIESFLDQHKCEAAVLSCIDFRFIQDLCRHLKEDVGVLSFDLLTMAGSAKDLIEGGVGKYTLLRDLRISRSLHNIKKIVIVHHLDCGAYGGSKAFESREKETEFHKDQLIRARNILKCDKELSGMEILLLFISEKDGKPEYLTID